ncbi:MAG: chemotaxis protein MotB [Silicimonas sp.]|nr:chemotaxis protein MotB [Silicimonas sp.]
MSDQPAPIIIRRKKVIAGGHHGGAWKVAYADFVTAMMAFFLLMWLLGATTEKQRKGIADYFNPTIPVNKVSGGGEGAFGGDSVFTQNTLAKNGTGAGVTMPTATTPSKGANGDADDDSDGADGAGKDPLAELKDMLAGKGGESMVSDLLSRHVVTRLTDEGLIVEVFDIPGAPLFVGPTTPSPVLQSVARAVGEVFQLASNDIAVQGHMASVPLAARENPVWSRSAERADVVRQLLTGEGLRPERMQRVTGFADRKPVSEDPLSIRNNRIEIILLRNNL